jgi:hypothetical protein
MSQEDVAAATVPEQLIEDINDTKSEQETSSSTWNAVFFFRKRTNFGVIA